MRWTTGALAAVIAAVPLAASAQAATANAGTTTVITGQGVVTRPATTATVMLNLITNDDVADTATSKNNALFEALKSKIAPLGVSAANIKTMNYNMSFNPRAVATDGRPVPTVNYPYQQRYGYVVMRQLMLTVADVANVGKVVDAAIATGVTNVQGVNYGLLDRKEANDAALAAALENAASQARAVAAASHMRIVATKQIQVGTAYNYPMPMGPRGPMQQVPTELPPATVDVRATVTVTYLLK